MQFGGSGCSLDGRQLGCGWLGVGKCLVGCVVVLPGEAEV